MGRPNWDHHRYLGNIVCCCCCLFRMQAKLVVFNIFFFQNGLAPNIRTSKLNTKPRWCQYQSCITIGMELLFFFGGYPICRSQYAPVEHKKTWHTKLTVDELDSVYRIYIKSKPISLYNLPFVSILIFVLSIITSIIQITQYINTCWIVYGWINISNGTYNCVH